TTRRRTMHVEHFMTKNPVACDVHEPVENVARLMRDKGVGCVVVLRNGKVAGLVTDRQLAIGVLAEGMGADAAVEDVMTTDPACCTLEDNLFSVIDTMRSAGVVRRLPVVNANKELLGIVSISDISVIAKDLLDGVFLEEMHNAMSGTHVLTGAKRIVKDIRRPTKLDRLPPEQETRPVTHATPPGVSASGGAGNPPGTQRAQKRTPSMDEAEGSRR
ncbi:MAG TPA: CBS domain-containing protein, partial [Candidatus Thermoplasmatota archaeon]|nr:CBS domain-containing protein [Candidatus Thermoplasmatota archaeon]